MEYKIENHNEIKNVLETLNPVSGKSIIFLPENIYESTDSSRFIYPETTSEIRKVFKSKQVSIGYLTGDKPLLRSRKYADWVGPTLFISFSLLTENFHLVGISLNLLSSYLYDFFRGSEGKAKIKFDLVVEKKKNEEYSKISFEGNVESIKELEKIIKQLKK